MARKTDLRPLSKTVKAQKKGATVLGYRVKTRNISAAEDQ